MICIIYVGLTCEFEKSGRSTEKETDYPDVTAKRCKVKWNVTLHLNYI